MQVMLTGSVENPLAERDAAPTGKDERGRRNRSLPERSMRVTGRIS
jgi:hypothetical protein